MGGACDLGGAGVPTVALFNPISASGRAWKFWVKKDIDSKKKREDLSELVLGAERVGAMSPDHNNLDGTHRGIIARRKLLKKRIHLPLGGAAPPSGRRVSWREEGESGS